MTGESLQTSFWLMVLIQTIGSVDLPGRGARKMPAPRSYVAIFVTWLVLFVVAGIGAKAERAAAALGWLLVLVGTVIGPFGQTVVDFLRGVSTQFPAQPPPTPGGASTTPSSTGTVLA